MIPGRPRLNRQRPACFVRSSARLPSHGLLTREPPADQPAGVNEGYLRPYQRNKKKHVFNKNKTSILERHNAAQPPIPRSLSLPTSHPLRVSRPSFMFKDYLLIQNVQGHETEEKREQFSGVGRKGMAWLYLFIGFHINPLEHGAVCAPFPGVCECFRAIKRKTEFSMDSM